MPMTTVISNKFLLISSPSPPRRPIFTTHPMSSDPLMVFDDESNSCNLSGREFITPNTVLMTISFTGELFFALMTKITMKHIS